MSGVEYVVPRPRGSVCSDRTGPDACRDYPDKNGSLGGKLRDGNGEFGRRDGNDVMQDQKYWPVGVSGLQPHDTLSRKLGRVDERKDETRRKRLTPKFADALG